MQVLAILVLIMIALCIVVAGMFFSMRSKLEGLSNNFTTFLERAIERQKAANSFMDKVNENTKIFNKNCESYTTSIENIDKRLTSVEAREAKERTKITGFLQ